MTVTVKGQTTAAEIMSTSTLTVPSNMPLPALAQLLAERHFSGAPVQDPVSGDLVGMVTEGDIIRRLSAELEQSAGLLTLVFGNTATAARRYARAHGMTVADVMTPAPLAHATETTTASEIARMMEQRRIRRVPVLRDGRLVGIVSRADLLRAVLRNGGPEENSTDAGIAREFHQRLLQEVWTDMIWHTADVKDGVLTLHGFVRSEDVRRALHALAENIPGVTRVEDRLTAPPFGLHGFGLR